MRNLIFAVIFLSACAGTATKPPAPAEVTAQDQRYAVRNQGYSLLYQLVSDEQNVSKLLIVKKENADLGALIKDIARVSGEATKELERFSKADSHLHLKMPGLPVVEQQTRDLIAKTKAKELVSKTGEKFEVRLVLTQAEALTYGAHLAVAIIGNETDPARRQFLSKVSEDYQELHQRIIDLIHARWSASPGAR
jgi:hypothetical protein